MSRSEFYRSAKIKASKLGIDPNTLKSKWKKQKTVFISWPILNENGLKMIQ